MEEEDQIADHKLCGYLRTVLTLPNPTAALPFLSSCRPFSDGLTTGFVTENGVFLSVIGDANANHSTPLDVESSGKKRGKRGIVMVSGSLSVVHQIHALVANKCVRVRVRVLGSEVKEGEGRVVVLVDVYLHVDLWSGWQFPKSGAVAGALFRHLSCDWEKRSLLLIDGNNAQGGNSTVWNPSDCHVIGCHLHCNVSDSSSKGRFELHEIFKGLPSVTNKEKLYSSRIKPDCESHAAGIWDVADDLLINILAVLGPMDLVRVAATCHHLRSLTASIMPCMKLKLFPHQEAAVEWMLQRERNSESVPHPLYMNVSTEDGFLFYINTVSGELVTEVAPTVRDFRGGMFCDEPGLGKTITALSLILKTQGTIADPPDKSQITWCTHKGDSRCGYYDISGDDFTSKGKLTGSRENQSARRRQLYFDKVTSTVDLCYSSPKRARTIDPEKQVLELNVSCPDKEIKSVSAAREVRCTRNLNQIKKNLLYSYGEESGVSSKTKAGKRSNKRKSGFNVPEKANTEYLVLNETWVQCDSCRKWRKLIDAAPDSTATWFCSMNPDSAHQTCKDPQEAWDSCESITYLPGFYTKGTSGANEENVLFFTSVLKEYYSKINSKTKKALTWLAKLSPEKLSYMETTGLTSPILGPGTVGVQQFHKIFQALGLIWRVDKGVSKWYYPRSLENLAFDVDALRMALGNPMDSFRLYLSRATLIVVPANLVDHWKTQIQRHIKPDQLRVCIWTDHKKPSAHSLAWDYDVVITTFSRLSAEWGPKKESPLMKVHWLRVILDEGHTLGSSLTLTNKLQMAISLTASNRWLLTGTPTPNTPNSQLSHLQPILKFLHEDAYGKNQKTWEAGILRPFEAEMEEGRSRLVQLLHRCLISARKKDLKNIPPCIKKVTFLDFTEEHARSYNELVVTVRRNILMADWNDPSHVESLLNPKQWKFRSALIRNVRLSCCVAGHIKVTEAGEDIQETMDLLVEKGLDPISEEYALIKYCLQYGSNCVRCKEWCRLPVITPCRHLLCLGCVALDSEKCTFPGCGSLYEMQSPESLTRPENPNPKWPVPKDLIELQPSYKQDDWDPDWQSTSSSKVSYLVQRLKDLQEANSVSGNLNINEQICPSQNSPSNALLGSFSGQSFEKVLIFSQFLEHLHVVEHQLKFAGINFVGYYSPMHSSNKMKSLTTFQHDPTCMALLMDGSAALGLDLSFVSHVFLMEPIWDRSMEEQVISRAHRMGATRPIHVETLAMRGTIEERMLAFLQDTDGCRRLLREEPGKTDHDQGTKSHRSLHDFAERNYLAQLSFVRTSSYAFSNVEDHTTLSPSTS
ncbi:SNF2 domain-containing protein / helicase domain-containing protein / F-box family protein [Euphorbia peplus]|nr:SNF2 domain-containing protein / helicase domain-containing protein / F-box family protein [Euphorbia peplus]